MPRSTILLTPVAPPRRRLERKLWIVSRYSAIAPMLISMEDQDALLGAKVEILDPSDHFPRRAARSSYKGGGA